MAEEDPKFVSIFMSVFKSGLGDAANDRCSDHLSAGCNREPDIAMDSNAEHMLVISSSVL